VPNVRTGVLVGIGVSPEGCEISHPKKGAQIEKHNCIEIKENYVPSQSKGFRNWSFVDATLHKFFFFSTKFLLPFMLRPTQTDVRGMNRQMTRKHVNTLYTLPVFPFFLAACMECSSLPVDQLF
jgi:hypothetical protein